MEKLIITAAICGAEVTKENNPAVPYTVEEIAREAESAYKAGASIIHLHVRYDDGTQTNGNIQLIEAQQLMHPSMNIKDKRRLLMQIKTSENTRFTNSNVERSNANLLLKFIFVFFIYFDLSKRFCPIPYHLQ